MNNIPLNRYLAAVFASVMMFSSCEGFLDRMPEASIPEDEAMTNIEEAQQVLFGIYSSFKNPSLYGGTMTVASEIQCDLVYAVDGFSNSYADQYRWLFRSTDNNIAAIYSGLYQIISRCNFFFDHQAEVEASLETDEDRELMDKCIGDVYMARALAFSELIRFFCEAYDPARADEQLGISIPLTYDDSVPVPLRSSLSVSYKRVLDDLAMAEKYITREGGDAPFFTKGLINAMYARTYLYMKDWGKAIEYSTKVIEDDNYKLTDATVGYANFNNTVISEYQYMWIYDTGSEIIWKISLSSKDANSFGGALSKPFHNYNYVTWRPDYVPAQWVLNLYKSNDMRYTAFFSEKTTGYAHGLKWPLLTKNFTNPNLDGSTGYLFCNMPKVFRLSEQYLIRAEARYMNKDEKGACEDLTVLKRKRLTGFGSVSLSGEKLFEEIKNERVRELLMEGFRLSDLKRWNQGFERHPQTASLPGPDNDELKVSASNPRFVWPIPQHELDAVPGMQPNASNN